MDAIIAEEIGDNKPPVHISRFVGVQFGKEPQNVTI